MKSLNQKFMEEISRCASPELFIGVARILGVQLLTDEKDDQGHHIPKDFAVIFADVMKAYDKSDRKRKRELLKIFGDANKAIDTEEDSNASNTENTEG